MKRSVIKELIKRSMREVAPKTNSGAMTPEEEKDAATINRYEKEEKEKDLRNGPSVVPGALPMKEDSDIPTDIEWEVVDVLGGLDDYSAELAMQGYSPTTGKSYTAGVDGTAAGGGDWDWSFHDLYNIEEMPEDSPINEASSKSAEILNRPAGHMTFEQMGMIIMLADAVGENKEADEFLSKVASKKEAGQYIQSLITKVDGDEGVLAEADRIVAAYAKKQTTNSRMLTEAENYTVYEPSTFRTPSGYKEEVEQIKNLIKQTYPEYINTDIGRIMDADMELASVAYKVYGINISVDDIYELVNSEDPSELPQNLIQVQKAIENLTGEPMIALSQAMKELNIEA